MLLHFQKNVLKNTLPKDGDSPNDSYYFYIHSCLFDFLLRHQSCYKAQWSRDVEYLQVGCIQYNVCVLGNRSFGCDCHSVLRSVMFPDFLLRPLYFILGFLLCFNLFVYGVL